MRIKVTIFILLAMLFNSAVSYAQTRSVDYDGRSRTYQEDWLVR